MRSVKNAVQIFFCAPYLDGANDNHIAVLAKLQEELEEATEAIQDILDMSLINKKKKDDLTEKEMDKLEDCFEQIYDVGPATQFAILRFAELFELDPEKIRLRNKKSSTAMELLREKIFN